jgi:hypothetical protein
MHIRPVEVIGFMAGEKGQPLVPHEEGDNERNGMRILSCY